MLRSLRRIYKELILKLQNMNMSYQLRQDVEERCVRKSLCSGGLLAALNFRNHYSVVPAIHPEGIFSKMGFAVPKQSVTPPPSAL